MQNVIAFISDSTVLDSLNSALEPAKSCFQIEVVSTQSELIRCLDRSSIVVTDLPTDIDLPFLQEIAATCAPKFSTPIIILTSSQNEHLAVKALREVATSYVPIRFIESELVPTLRTVSAASKAQQNRMRIMDSVTLWHNEFVLENDTSLVGPLVRYLQESTQRMGLLTDPGEETRLGIALEEALHNSIYHGNLEVSSSLREEDDAKFYEMVNLRKTESPYTERRVRVRAEFCREQAVFEIQDEGPGFDISKVPDPTDPENVERVCGRGMLLMRTFMDEVTYNDVGNKVTLLKRAPQQTDAASPG